MAGDMRHKFFKAYCTALIDRGGLIWQTRRRRKKKCVGFEPPSLEYVTLQPFVTKVYYISALGLTARRGLVY